AIERNAFLESELDEKETLAGLVQRLKDEARDLRQELLIHKSLSKPLDNDSRIKKTVLDIDSNKLRSEHQTQTGTLNKVVPPTGHTRLTPSARISALNIVGDLLRKIGALESKLASCRTLVQESSPRLDKEESSSPVMSPTNIQLTKELTLSSCSDFIHLTA
ncbi:nuclear distribution protein nudE homolog 1-like, partial [Limulus polyphemus]|uniref:Nuclear distribution protein nudE homolog 1-like n=1 Tax=Limulus polyphemus TaxID=6850 RepID=A0ABM1C2C1_LIMPO